MNIIGAGGHAKVIIDILMNNNIEISGIWDDNKTLSEFLGFKILGDALSLDNKDFNDSIIAIGDNKARKRIANQLNISFGSAIHPKSWISASAELGEGAVVMSNVSVNTDVVVGKHVIINTNASIDHDCKIDDFVHISPQVGLGGSVEIGEGTHVGIGANVIQGIRIGKWATIGAGSVIIRDIPDYAVVVGNPGRIIKYNPI